VGEQGRTWLDELQSNHVRVSPIRADRVEAQYGERRELSRVLADAELQRRLGIAEQVVDTPSRGLAVTNLGSG